jgi:hypothetical protein
MQEDVDRPMDAGFAAEQSDKRVTRPPWQAATTDMPQA